MWMSCTCLVGPSRKWLSYNTHTYIFTKCKHTLKLPYMNCANRIHLNCASYDRRQYMYMFETITNINGPSFVYRKYLEWVPEKRLGVVNFWSFARLINNMISTDRKIKIERFELQVICEKVYLLGFYQWI